MKFTLRPLSAISGLALASLGFLSSASAQTTTIAPIGLTATNATLRGSANPGGLPTVAFFHWGSSAGYGNSTAPVSIGSGSAVTTASAAITGLAPLHTYHFQMVASNSAGVTTGSDATFVTPVQAFALLNPTVISNSLVFDFFATTNGQYSVWATTNFVDWSQFGPRVTLLTNHLTLQLPASTTGRFFYQMRSP
ncbi:MAG TPA: hypothetical protein VHB20_15405 [Verrucomicrobiae bacterium]|nr:hypothetical protein [Verrucomicrobiae bacterium]